MTNTGPLEVTPHARVTESLEHISALSSQLYSMEQFKTGKTEASSRDLTRAEKVLPVVSLDSKDSVNTASSALTALAQGFAYSLLQAPLEGLSQVYDHTVGSIYGSDVYDSTKDLLVSAPKEARFGSLEWHAQSVGSALGALPWFIIVRNAVRKTAGVFDADL
jgi:hypothetical protein